MAVDIHVARIGVFNVDRNGQRIDKSTTTLRGSLQTSIDHLIIEDSNIPNTAGNPTIKQYLELEAADGYVANHISQNLIVTYDSAAL